MLKSDFGVRCRSGDLERLVRIDTVFCAGELGRRHGLDPHAVLAKVRDFYSSQTDVAEEPFDGSREVCDAMGNRGGINALVTHRDRESAVAMLRRFDMLDLFSVLLTPDDGFPPKPAPDSFDYVVEKESLDRRETLAVGDRNMDIEAALAAGILSAFFNPGGIVHPKADFSIRALREITKL